MSVEKVDMETLLWINDAMLKAPLGVVAMVFAIMLGYMLKSASVFPNKFIPWVTMPFTAIVFMVLNLCADLMAATPHPWLRMPGFFVYGFIFGGFAWFFHARVLKGWIDPKLFNEDGTRRFLKSDGASGAGPS